MKKIYQYFLVSSIISFIGACICFSISGNILAHYKQYVPAVTELDVAKEALPFAAVSAHSGEMPYAAASTGQEVLITGNAGEAPVSAWFQTATANYGAVAGFLFTEGGFSMSDASQKTIVIPESLSLQLFSAETGLYQTVYLDNEPFLVCGIYKEGGALARLGCASVPVIYSSTAPSSNENAGEEESLLTEHIFIPGTDSKTSEQQKQEVSKLLEVALQGKISDLFRQQRLAEGFPGIGCFLCCFWILFRLCAASYRCVLAVFDSTDSSRKQKKYALCALGLFLVSVAGFRLSLNLIQIPACYLPEENLFQLSHYWNLFCDKIAEINGRFRPLDFSKRSLFYLSAEAVFLFAGVLFFYSGSQKLYRVICLWKDRKKAGHDGVSSV